MKKYAYKCAGPSNKNGLSYCCPLKSRGGNGNLLTSALYGKIYTIDTIIEREEVNYNSSLVIDGMNNYQPLCLFCHFQKKQIYKALKEENSLIHTELGKLWSHFRHNIGPLYGTEIVHSS